MLVTFHRALLLVLGTTTSCQAWLAPSPHHRSLLRFRSTATDSSSTAKTTPGSGTTPHPIVTIDCRLEPEGDFVPEPLIDGVVFQPTDPPVRLTFGLHQGNYLPGLHQLVDSLIEKQNQQQQQQQPTSNNEAQLDNVRLDAGWGSRRDDLVVTVPLDTVQGLDKTQIQVGVELVLANGLTAVVTNVTDEAFTMDANPPLAGATYRASVRLVAVEPGPVMTVYNNDDNSDMHDIDTNNDDNSRYHVATFALGCFWGAELAFQRQPGVVATAVGYTQGTVANPTYEQVCSGTTGHTEAIAVTYDPTVASYEQLVELALDRLGPDNLRLLHQVGNDRGPQYRHGIYYHTTAQKDVAQAILSRYRPDECVTECLPAQHFWYAEDYHQQYLLKGGQSARKNDSTTIRCYG